MAREQVTRVYREVMVPVAIDGVAGSPLALTFVAEPTHPQYAGTLAEAEAIELLRTARGSSGTARDYLMATLAHLRALNIMDEELERLAARL